MADRTHSHDTSTPAMSAETVPSEEFVLVPREPTERMLEAADGWTDLIDAAGGNTPESRRSEFRVAWRAMIAAAPAPSPSPAAKGGDAVREAEEIARIVYVSMRAAQFMDKLPEWDQNRRSGSRLEAMAAARKIVALSTPTEGPAPQTEGMGGDATKLRENIEAFLEMHRRGVLTPRTPNIPIELLQKALAALTPPETAEAVPVASDPAPATDERERLVEADQRHPSMFYSPDRESRIGVAHYGGVGGPLPTVTVSTLLENRPGGRWVEVQLAPDEAEQMALHLLDKVASARAVLATEASR